MAFPRQKKTWLKPDLKVQYTVRQEGTTTSPCRAIIVIKGGPRGGSRPSVADKKR